MKTLLLALALFTPFAGNFVTTFVHPVTVSELGGEDDDKKDDKDDDDEDYRLA